MSGQPLRNPTDASKFRQQYLANLQLRAKLDQENLEANKVFRKTGQSPIPPPDTRTTTEKLADIERLKLDVRSGLSQITDGTQSNIIIQSLAPYELIFLSQNLPQILTDLKPKFKVGILAPIFIDYLRRYMRKWMETRGVEQGLQQNAGANVLLNIQQIQRDMVTLDDLEMVAEFLSRNQGLIGRNTDKIIDEIESLRQTLPTQSEIQSINELGNEMLKSDIQVLLNDALQELPTKTMVIDLMRELEQANRTGNRQLAQSIARQLEGILTIEPATKADIEEIKRLIEESRGVGEKGEQEDFPPHTERQILEAEARAMGAEDVELTEQEKIELNKLEGRIPIIRQAYKTTAQLTTKPDGKKVGKEIRTDYIKEMIAYLDIPSVRNLMVRLQIVDANGAIKTTPSIEDQLKMIRYINRRASYLKNERNEEPVEAGGYGFKRGRGRPKMIGGRIAPKLSADYSNAIMPDIKYTPVGRYFLDHRKLGDNIISLKRGNGINVSGFPIQRVSNDLGDVIRIIIGGGQPKFEKLEKLSQEEKHYLHKLAKSSQILDRLSIPTPDKDDDEKDIHNFEVMKGEILSGNDSNELIKKFKLLIVKMTHKGLLPKTQSKDLLMNLATLGY